MVRPNKPPTSPPPIAFACAIEEEEEEEESSVAAGEEITADAVVLAGIDCELIVDEAILVDDVTLADADAFVVEVTVELVGDGIALDSVRLALFLAFVWSQLSTASTSKYAHPGTETPEGIGSGYVSVYTMAQLADHTLHERYVRPWQAPQALISEYVTVLHWQGFAFCRVGPK
jgi:hypothetical protein